MCLTLCDPVDCSPPGSSVHGISQSRILAAAAAKSLQSCPTLRGPIDGSPPGSSVPGILQARILQWVAIPFSRRSSQPNNQACISCLFFALQVDSLPPEPSGKSCFKYMYIYVNPNPLICRAGFLTFSCAMDPFDRLMGGYGIFSE